MPHLHVDDLRVAFPRAGGWVEVVRGVSFGLDRGECVALTGPSGSGKSSAALALLGLVVPPGRIAGGSVWLDGVDLLTLDDRALCPIRGRRLAMVFQEPGAALDPLATVLGHLDEAQRVHGLGDRATRRERAGELLDLVDVGRERLRAYPHELSGGERQRVAIAIGLAAEPEILIADEPTTALDAVVRAALVGLLGRLRRELGLGLVVVSHDAAVVAALADRVVAFADGVVVPPGLRTGAAR